MSWLDYLIDEGFLRPEQNPEPEAVPKGFIVPRFESLAYVLKLSNGFDNSTDIQIINKVIKVITDLSKNPRDNYHTWYTCIKILSNIPNEKIPLSILDYIPVWLSGRFDTMLQSSELIEVLLPKFLGEAPSEADILKAGKIIKHLLDIEKSTESDPVTKPGSSYASRVYTYYLKEMVTKAKIKKQMVQHLQLSFFYILADQVNLLARDFAAAAEVKAGETSYIILCIPKDKNLQIIVRLLENNSVIEKGQVENYQSLEWSELSSRLEMKLATTIKDPKSRRQVLHRLSQNLYGDLMSLFGNQAIDELHEETHHGDELIYLFAYILREFLLELACSRPTDANNFLRDLLRKQEYHIPIFRRMALYIIAGSWQNLKDVFFDMIQDGDRHRYFSDYKYERDLDYLLKAVQTQLNNSESTKIVDIIEAGPKDDEYPEDHQQWKLRWLSVLKDHPVFAALYQKLAKELEVGDLKVPKRGRSWVTIGPNSPFSVDEIQNMDQETLLRNIREFPDSDRFGEPSAEGFAENLMKAVEKEPAKFVDMIMTQPKVAPLYIYYLLLGLTKAWKDHLTFDWETVLNFCNRYIDEGKDYQPLSDRTRPFKWEWLFSEIGRLISEGMRDDNEFDERLMPLSKEILLHLGANLQFQEMGSHSGKVDYVGYSLNSNAGPILRAALDYSLRWYRMAVDKGEAVKMELREIFDASFEKGIIDTYVLVGMYLPHFFLLDKEWTEAKIREFNKIEDSRWKPFIAGLSFAQPAWSKEIYLLLYPHYERSLDGKEPVDTRYQHGIIRHLTAYYLWDYNNGDRSLMEQLIHKSNPENVKELLQFLRQQTAYLEDLSADEQENTRRKVIELWKKIADGAVDGFGDSEEIFSRLIYLSKYLNFLDEELVNLLLKSVPFLKDYTSSSGMLTTLIRLKDLPSPVENAPHIAHIMEALPFADYISEDQQELVKTLVTFLFEQGEKGIAKYICNKLTIKGYDFLIDTYNQYHRL